MRAVVTGGAGFIGSNLVDALVARGDEVTVVDNFATGKREFVNAAAVLLEHDVREPFELEADVVFHLAAQADVQTSMKQPGYDAAVNVVGTANVLDASPGRTTSAAAATPRSPHCTRLAPPSPAATRSRASRTRDSATCTAPRSTSR